MTGSHEAAKGLHLRPRCIELIASQPTRMAGFVALPVLIARLQNVAAVRC
jgi:hypothetical protein